MSATIAKRQKFLTTAERTQLQRRRNNYDILAMILGACKKRPRTQSWLISNLRLSTSSAKNYVGFLVAAKLIEASKPQGRRNYKITADGEKALKYYTILTTQYFSVQSMAFRFSIFYCSLFSFHVYLSFSPHWKHSFISFKFSSVKVMWHLQHRRIWHLGQQKVANSPHESQTLRSNAHTLHIRNRFFKVSQRL